MPIREGLQHCIAPWHLRVSVQYWERTQLPPCQWVQIVPSAGKLHFLDWLNFSKSLPGWYGATVALRYLDIYTSEQLTWNSRATSWHLWNSGEELKAGVVWEVWVWRTLWGWCFSSALRRDIPKCVSGAGTSAKLGLCELDLGSKPTWLQQTPSGTRALGRRSDSTTTSIKRTGYAKVIENIMGFGT